MVSLEAAPNAELLSTLCGVKPAQELLQHYGSLTGIARASVDELRQLKGVGQSRAAAIRAAFLLAQRLSREACPEAPILDTPERVADLLRETNRLYTVEHFQIACLNTRRRLLGIERLTQGILDQVLVHAREVFAVAIAKRASAIVLVHNHPSGDPTPSEADIKVTRDLIRAGQLLKIDVLDHIILGTRTAERAQDFTSLRQLGHFYSA